VATHKLYKTACTNYDAYEVIKMKRVTTAAAREGFSALVNEVAYGGERVVLTRRGHDIALLCSLSSEAMKTSELSPSVAAEATAVYGRELAIESVGPGLTIASSQLTMRGSQCSLAGLFASPTLVAVLRVLLLHRGGSFHQRELARLAGAGLRSVQAETRRLEGMGLVASVRSGNRRTYSIDWDHPAAEDLRRLFARSFAVPEVLGGVLAPLGDTVEVAFVYGSIAKGEEIATSDVDLLVVGSIDGVQLAAVLEDAERLIGRTVNASVYSTAEFEAKLEERNHFLRSVLAGPIIVVAGDSARLAS